MNKNIKLTKKEIKHIIDALGIMAQFQFTEANNNRKYLNEEETELTENQKKFCDKWHKIPDYEKEYKEIVDRIQYWENGRNKTNKLKNKLNYFS